MAEKRRDTLEGGGFFGASQKSFDLEKTTEPVRRRKRGERARAPPVQQQSPDSTQLEQRRSVLDHDAVPVQDSVSNCPGCGNDISEGDFVEAIVSFVTGAADYLAGDPIRSQAVQALRQQAKRMDLPEPYDDWLLEVCTRLEAQVARYVEARQGVLAAEIEERMRAELMGELYSQIRAEIEVHIRREVEAELWEEFQRTYQAQQDTVSDSNQA
ncbi:MAG: hypothetical protein MK233_01450 [Candidatus Poseidoniales archaeon]|nr:hypothetical protein [Candidatus Poseidoniales archaeon]